MIDAIRGPGRSGMRPGMVGKRRAFRSARATYVLAVLACSLVACGTEGGNPVTSEDLRSAPAASGIAVAICARLTACHPSALTVAQCQSRLLASNVIETELGLLALGRSYAAIIEGEGAGTLVADAAAGAACASQIDALSCGDPAVTQAFDPAQPSDLSAIDRIVPTAAGGCPDVF
jgi:hypothetical protein